MASVLLRYIFLKTFNKVILSHKKSYSTLQAKQATFTNWVDKSSLKTPKQVLQLSFLSHFMHQTKHFCIQGRFFILQHWWSSEIFATRPWSLFQRIGNGFINVGWHRISSAGVWLRLRFDNCSISLRWPIKKDKPKPSDQLLQNFALWSRAIWMNIPRLTSQNLFQALIALIKNLYIFHFFVYNLFCFWSHILLYLT